jgi:Leucine-rich repeat (LRR) protein
MRTTVAAIAAAVILFGCGGSQPRQLGVRPEETPALDSNLVSALAHPEKATRLTLAGSDLDTLPPELWTLHNLRELNLSCQEQLKKLPPEIGQLGLLEKLIFDCGNGGIMNLSLPEEIGKLNKLTVLTLYGAMDPSESRQSPPARLPDAVRNLTNLKELNLGRNRLTSVPEQIASLENLATLILSFNEIHEIPEFVGNLKKLRQLSLDGNGGLKLPVSLSQAQGLKVAAGNDHLDWKTQEALRHAYPGIDFDFANEFDDCSANEPADGYPDWQKECGGTKSQ